MTIPTTVETDEVYPDYPPGCGPGDIRSSYCAACGNETCDTPYENRCNCGTDCKESLLPTTPDGDASAPASVDASQPANPHPEDENIWEVEALQIGGVWVFQHTTDEAMLAAFWGPAEIVDGCLFVNDTIVIWHVSRLDDVQAAIVAIQSGDPVQLETGGGGRSLDDGDQIPTAISDHCSTSSWYYGAPGP